MVVQAGSRAACRTGIDGCKLVNRFLEMSILPNYSDSPSSETRSIQQTATAPGASSQASDASYWRLVALSSQIRIPAIRLTMYICIVQ